MASRWPRVHLPWIVALVILVQRPCVAITKDLAGVVNLNTAEPGLLGLLSGIGPAKARAIVSYRARHPFRTVDELVRVKGIGRRMVRRLRLHLAVAGPSTARIATGAAGSPSPGPPPEPIHAIPAAPRPRWAPLVRSLAVPSRALRPPVPVFIRSHANHCVLPR